MKYLCNVKQGVLTKHIIEVNGRNVEVTEGVHKYKFEKPSFEHGETCMEVKTLQLKVAGGCLSQVVLSCELFNFIIGYNNELEVKK